MPYYLFRVSVADRIGLVKQLELVEEFDAFRDASKRAKQLRREAAGEEASYKVSFADNRLAAEEQLQEKREKPVLMEHER